MQKIYKFAKLVSKQAVHLAMSDADKAAVEKYNVWTIFFFRFGLQLFLWVQIVLFLLHI